MGTLRKNLYTFMIVFRCIILKMRTISEEGCKKIIAHILYSATVFRKSFRLWDNVENYCRAGEAAKYNINTAHALFVLAN